MTTYRVIYEIDVEADTPEAAAQDAFECLHGDEGPVLVVVPWPNATNAPPGVASHYSGAVELDLQARPERR